MKQRNLDWFYYQDNCDVKQDSTSGVSQEDGPQLTLCYLSYLLHMFASVFRALEHQFQNLIAYYLLLHAAFVLCMWLSHS